MSFINKRYKTKIPTTKELNNYEYKKMKLHNGDYMKGEYPEYYEFELDTYYKELIKESKNIHKRTRK